MPGANPNSARRGRRASVAAAALLGLFAAGCVTDSENDAGPQAEATGTSSATVAARRMVVPPTCRARLRAIGAEFEWLGRHARPNGCGFHEGVRVTAINGVAFTEPAILECETAEYLGNWLDQVVQPAAQELVGQRVTQLVVFSSYQCRYARGRTRRGPQRRFSQHAFGKAIDIGGFVMEDGNEISVLRHWRADGPPRNFLHQVAISACATFSKVFTPYYDRHHRHHFHFDLAEQIFCPYDGEDDGGPETVSDR
jgi:hypothetical protein